MDDLFYFDTRFWSGFFLPSVARRVHPHPSDVSWSCRGWRSILQKPELISAVRQSVLHCQRPGNAILEHGTRRCVSFDPVCSHPSSISIKSWNFFQFFVSLTVIAFTKNLEIESRQESVQKVLFIKSSAQLKITGIFQWNFSLSLSLYFIILDILYFI